MACSSQGSFSLGLSDAVFTDAVFTQVFMYTTICDRGSQQHATRAARLALGPPGGPFGLRAPHAKGDQCGWRVAANGDAQLSDRAEMTWSISK